MGTAIPEGILKARDASAFSEPLGLIHPMMDGQDSEDCVEAATKERKCLGVSPHRWSCAQRTPCDHRARRLNGDDNSRLRFVRPRPAGPIVAGHLILLFSLIRLFIIFGELEASAVVAANGVESRHSRTPLIGCDLPMSIITGNGAAKWRCRLVWGVICVPISSPRSPTLTVNGGPRDTLSWNFSYFTVNHDRIVMPLRQGETPNRIRARKSD
jgi:hypothetical protein